MWQWIRREMRVEMQSRLSWKEKMQFRWCTEPFSHFRSFLSMSDDFWYAYTHTIQSLKGGKRERAFLLLLFAVSENGMWIPMSLFLSPFHPCDSQSFCQLVILVSRCSHDEEWVQHLANSLLGESSLFIIAPAYPVINSHPFAVRRQLEGQKSANNENQDEAMFEQSLLME